uniref:HIG1 domain-containing protein n=1 Tax=Strigamia maritima TaxID=126957 RepID=T1IQI7_STRMM
MAPNETKVEEKIDINPKKKVNEDEDAFDWISLRKEINIGVLPPEGLRERIIRKNRENPFVAIGCVGTAGVLGYGLWCFRTGQVKRSQAMMRLRVIAQGITVTALLIGVATAAMKKKDSPTLP